ncbi:MAG: hypothetical protein RLZZ08_49 [Pseudomonadota bacterium]|jgi:phage terminase large subunit-like protein
MVHDDRAAFLATLTPAERQTFRWHWDIWARPEQLPPSGDWSQWLVCAGRGFGKSRLGAEWVRQVARDDPKARIALVGGSLAEVRAVMVEGESGIMACYPPQFRPEFAPSLRRLTWPNGAQACLYSAAEPESLRGPQHSHAWCDEIGKWDMAAGRAVNSWDNLLLGLRLGEHPRVLATTTPRAVPLMQRLMAEVTTGNCALTQGRTYDNAANLPPRFVTAMRRKFGRSALGRQELDGEMLTEVDGALWTRAMLETCRAEPGNSAWQRVVIGVDPPASARGDECGIVAAALDSDGVAHVLADASIGRASPERWAAAVAQAADRWGADRIVAEANQGGDMVRSVLRAADCAMPVQLVHASRGKAARAEPVAALYETGRVRHAGLFPRLEDQLCGLLAGGTYEGPGRSPDRADALVWALTELMLGKRATPRVLHV